MAGTRAKAHTCFALDAALKGRSSTVAAISPSLRSSPFRRFSRPRPLLYESRIPLIRHQVAGVGLDDQPDFAACCELQCVSRSESQVDLHFHSAIHSRGNDYVTLLYIGHAAGNQVAGA
jgi:hypothetical protein